MKFTMYKLLDGSSLVGLFTEEQLIVHADVMAQGEDDMRKEEGDEESILTGELITTIEDAIRYLQAPPNALRVEKVKATTTPPPPVPQSDFEVLREAFEKIGYPFIAHESEKSGTKNIVVCNDDSDVRAFEENQPLDFPAGPRFEFNHDGVWTHVWE